jgi:hypothetical protein
VIYIHGILRLFRAVSAEVRGFLSVVEDPNDDNGVKDYLDFVRIVIE